MPTGAYADIRDTAGTAENRPGEIEIYAAVTWITGVTAFHVIREDRKDGVTEICG